MRGEIKRSKGLDGVLEGHDARPEDEEKRIEVVSDVDFEGLMRKYENVLDTYLSQDKPITQLTEVLTPRQINIFLLSTAVYEEHGRYHTHTGKFITNLIQNSHDAGYNDFCLDTKHLKTTHYIGLQLKGKNKRVKVTLNGPSGLMLGYNAKRAEFEVTGNINGWCGQGADRSIFTIHQGDIGSLCGNRATRSVFKTPNDNIVHDLLFTVPEGNRIVFITPDGEEKIYRYANGKVPRQNPYWLLCERRGS